VRMRSGGQLANQQEVNMAPGIPIENLIPSDQW